MARLAPSGRTGRLRPPALPSRSLPALSPCRICRFRIRALVRVPARAPPMRQLEALELSRIAHIKGWGPIDEAPPRFAPPRVRGRPR